MPPTIGIFPAAGGIGGSTVKHLLQKLRLPTGDRHEQLVLIARHPETQLLVEAAKAGATIRRADYDDDRSLERAFGGIDALFLISYASVEHGYRTEVCILFSSLLKLCLHTWQHSTLKLTMQRHLAAIDNAINQGVKYIFYASLGFAGNVDNKETVALVMRPHIDTEKYLDECTRRYPGFSYTIIREGLYAESYPVYMAFFSLDDEDDEEEEIKIPHDGSGPGIAWVKRDELGEGSAEILRRFVSSDRSAFEKEFKNRTVLLSGPRALSLNETVEILARKRSRPIRIRQVSGEEFAEQPRVGSSRFVHRGVDYAREWETVFEGIRRGECAVVSPLLGELLGREPEGFEEAITQQ